MTDLTPETLSALLERVRVEHDTGIDDDGWVGCRTCGVPLQVERDEEGQPLCNPFIRHRYDKAAEAIAALVVDALAAEKAARQEAEQGCDEAMLRNIEYLARADKAEARVAELVNCAPRFWSKVNMDQPCWLWTGSLGDNGYGRFSDGERLVVAHRWSYEMAKGPVPEGLDLDHLCRVRNCVNPDHLEPVTRSENNLRGIAARGTPTHCRRGHEMTPENFYQRPGGYRVCRKCKKAGDLRRRVRKAEERKSNGAL